MHQLKMGHSWNFLHVSDPHKVYCPRSRLWGECPTERVLYAELKSLDLLVLADLKKIFQNKQSQIFQFKRQTPSSRALTAQPTARKLDLMGSTHM